MHLDIIGSAFAISVFLLIYYTAVGFFTVYFTFLHGFSLSTANSIGDSPSGFDAVALILVGILSNPVRVRKPFMVLGGVGAIVMTIVFLDLGAKTSYATFAVVISILAVFLAIAYAPWMASFPETVEKRNPALTATGLAVWGWVIRAVIAISILILPSVISSMTPLVTYGAQAATIQATYPEQVATLAVIDPTTLAALHANPADTAAAATGGRDRQGVLLTRPSRRRSSSASASCRGRPGIPRRTRHGRHERGLRRARPVEGLVVGLRRRRDRLPAVHPADGGPLERP